MPSNLNEMDFDLDDPLGDLLSDGSNDSFFGTSKKKLDTPKSSAQASGDTKAKSIKVADLFGIDSKNNEESFNTSAKPSSDPNPVSNQSVLKSNTKKIIDEEDNAIGSTKILRESIKRSTLERSTQQVSTIAAEELNSNANAQNQPIKKDTRFDDSDDFLNELGFDPKHPKGNISGGKKTNILDDILNFTKPESVVTPKPAPSPAATKPNPSDGDRKNAQTIDTHHTNNRYSPSSRRTRNRPRSGSGADVDPLGFFASPSKQKNKTQETKKTENIETSMRQKSAKKPTVDWLGLESESEIKSIANTSIPVQLEKLSTQTSAQPTNFDDSTKPTAILNSIVPIENSNANDTSNVVRSTDIENMNSVPANTIQANLNMINVTSLEQENVLQSLKQQETHLRIATQMKQQESVLYDIQMKQQTLIKQQENQFNDLLRRQVDRQNQLESQIQRQQEQINAYINVLMNQPNIGLIATTKLTENVEINDTEKGEQNISRQNFIELEAEVKRLEIEKIRLEDILQSVQSSHEKELELLHMCHK